MGYGIEKRKITEQKVARHERAVKRKAFNEPEVSVQPVVEPGVSYSKNQVHNLAFIMLNNIFTYNLLSA